MFKKSNSKSRNIRKKNNDDEESETPATQEKMEEEATNLTPSTPISTPATPNPPSTKATPSTPRTLLSFDEEMEITPKENSARKLKRNEFVSPSPIASIVTQSIAVSPSYTPERMEELKKVSFSSKKSTTPLSSQKQISIETPSGSSEKPIVIVDDDEATEVKNIIDIEKMEEKEEEEDEESKMGN